MAAQAKTTESSSAKSGTLDVDTLMKLRIVIRAAQRHSAWIEKHCGVTGAQLWILQELHDAPGLRVGEVATKLAIHQTTTSNLLNNLLAKGYIEKVRDLEDQRVVKLVLSKKGATLLKKAPKPARGLLPEALKKMDRTKLANLNKGLDALVKVIGEADESFGMQPLPFTM